MTKVRKTSRGNERDNRLPVREEFCGQLRGILCRAGNGGHNSLVAAMFAVAFFGSAKQAHAYADPGSGALIWQMLIAGFVGVLFYLRKFVSWLSRGIGGSPGEESASQNQVQAELSTPEK